MEWLAFALKALFPIRKGPFAKVKVKFRPSLVHLKRHRCTVFTSHPRGNTSPSCNCFPTHDITLIPILSRSEQPPTPFVVEVFACSRNYWAATSKLNKRCEPRKDSVFQGIPSVVDPGMCVCVRFCFFFFCFTAFEKGLGLIRRPLLTKVTTPSPVFFSFFFSRPKPFVAKSYCASCGVPTAQDHPVLHHSHFFSTSWRQWQVSSVALVLAGVGVRSCDITPLPVKTRQPWVPFHEGCHLITLHQFFQAKDCWPNWKPLEDQNNCNGFNGNCFWEVWHELRTVYSSWSIDIPLE